MSESVLTPPAEQQALRRLLAKSFALFLSYLAVAMSLPVMSLHVVNHLHYGNVLAGLATGACFFTTILSRLHAGRWSDSRGGKYTMVRGLWLYALAGLICIASAWDALSPVASYAVLLIGRLILGLGESLTAVGTIAWGIALMGQKRSGKVLSMVGMAMYGALAVGSPLGIYLYQSTSFAFLMGACTLLPLVGLLFVQGLAEILPQGVAKRGSFIKLVGAISKQGAVVGLQGVGFAALGAFLALLFLANRWPHGSIGLTCFGGGFVLVRILCSNLPDRLGGTRVAIGSLLIEIVGQVCIWAATGPTLALIGAALTGIGCSMIYPAMGVEVIKRVTPSERATAVGGFGAFQDLAYFVTGPLAGVLADHFGYASIFLVGAALAIIGLLIAIWAQYDKPLRTPHAG